METQTPPAAPPPPTQQQSAPPPPPVAGPKKNVGMALLSYLGILVIIPLLTAKDDPFVKYHIKQGLVLLIVFAASWIIGMVPILGWLIAALLWLFGLVLMIIGIINAVNEKEQPLPAIGQFADHFHF